MGSEGQRGTVRSGRRDEAGAVIVIVASAMSVLIVMVALVIDLSGARRDRDADQLAADAMALAAAFSLKGAETSAVPACQAAWDYLVVNLPSAESAPVPSCATFGTVCIPATPRTIQATFGEYRITLTHPVPAGHALLQDRPAGSLDGIACDRIGVRIQQTRANLIASGSVDLDVSAVGRYVRGVGNVQAPLVLLAEHACQVLGVTGTGRLTVNTSTGAPGYIAIDSDGSACNNPNKVVLDIDGQGTIVAGAVSMWALADGDATSAYSPSLVSPTPVASSTRVGSGAMEDRYNCDPAAGCPGAGPPHIDQMVAAWGGPGAPTPPGSFTTWTASGRSCSPSGDTVVPAGNWYIDCGSAGLTTNGSLTFQGGNVVSTGPISASGPGGFRMNCSDTNPADLIAPVTCAVDPPAPAILYLRAGDLLQNGSVELRETMVYLTNGKMTFSGSNSLTWTAPDDPAHRFDDLLVWTTTTGIIKITGGSTTYLEGIVFAPNASLELAGNTGGQALRAQIFSRSARLVGGAQFTMAPEEDRIMVIGPGQPLLIR